MSRLIITINSINLRELWKCNLRITQFREANTQSLSLFTPHLSLYLSLSALSFSSSWLPLFSLLCFGISPQKKIQEVWLAAKPFHMPVLQGKQYLSLCERQSPSSTADPDLSVTRDSPGAVLHERRNPTTALKREDGCCRQISVLLWLDMFTIFRKWMALT